MMHPTENIRHFLRPGVRVHMAGIGGVSMCALAEVLKGMGLNVQGSDMTDSDTVKHLRSVGIPVTIGNDPKTAAEIEKTGARHQNCEVENVCVDHAHKIVTTPAYMLAHSIAEVNEGIRKLVAGVLKLS